MKKIRIAVAGLGRIGWDPHAVSLAAHKDFTLAAVCDPEKDRRDEAERRLGCATFPDFAAMLDGAPLDALVVAAPTHFHEDYAQAALRRGLHLMMEKPMARSYRGALRMVQTARRRRRVLTVFQGGRASARCRQLLEILRSGKIGRVVHAQLGLFSFWRRDDWQGLRKFGGGMLNNYAVHGLDELLQIVGFDVQRAACHLQLIASLGDAEDAVKIVFQTKRGVIADLDINQASPVRPYELIVWGTCGVIRREKGQFHLSTFDPAKLPRRKLDPGLARTDRKYIIEEVKFREETVPVDPAYAVDVYADFARAIRTGTAPLVKPEEALAGIRLIEQCRKSAGRIAMMK